MRNLISSFIEEFAGFPNRQAELDLQAFPNGVWEREKWCLWGN
ncbi:MAG: hypothetical protein PHP00_12745 [Thiotrichaceae bacterium]|nr:hypothetical protein [Thiotrichaceae bacterium]